MRAQTARLQLQRAPYYAGESLRLQLSGEGFDELPLPQLDFDPVDGARISVTGASPSVSESISIVNGEMSRSRVVKHVFDLQLLADQPGPLMLPAMRLSQGRKRAQSAPRQLQVQALPTNPEISVELRLPKRSLYVGERAPVMIRMRLPDSMQRNLESYVLRVPLFEASGLFHFIDSSEPGDVELRVVLASGETGLPAQVTEELIAGRPYKVFSAERTLIPLEVGRHQIPAARLMASEGVAFQRDFFRGRRPTRVRKWSATDRLRELVVRPIPREGRPESFAGSVGRGFTLEVSADRSVVQVGDPIVLSLVLRGEGLESASLPPLSAEGLLPPAVFRVPESELPGEFEVDEKRFSAQVRVLDAGVSEIPALAFSWFDPDRERFETTYSRPIALSVREAQRVGAESVERAPQAEAPARSEEPAASPLEWGSQADLAIVADARRLRAVSAHGGQVYLQSALYGVGLLLMVVALLDRRRRGLDPRVRDRRLALDRARRRLGEVATLTPEAALEEVTDLLRRMRAELPEVSAPEIESFLAECDTLRFAPVAGGADAALLARATALVAEFSERAR
jgi:hypothetical protein